MSADPTRIAARFIQAKKAERWMGINVSSYSDRYVEPREVSDQWWIDLESLLKEYWSLQRVQVGSSSSNLMWARVSGVGGPMEVQFMGSPERGMKVSIVGEAEKKFGPDASLKEMLLWVDKADRNRR